ncbi:peptidase M20 [Bacillaceae bacterium JMAK1]|nr:peptidase M20 [Bacillaceae bacterium JMAK1]
MALTYPLTNEAIFTQMVEWRRHFHRYPELSFQEVETPKYIANLLKDLGLDVREQVGGRGVVATLHGAGEGPTIAFRADFDALPIQEENNVAYASENPGVMHACGHDGHSAALLGVAHLLTEMKEELNGKVVFIFQHAEELTPGGAIAMVEDGCLDGVDVIFGAHVSSDLELGLYNVRSGAIMAAADAFSVEIQGKGGHGAKPHTTIDPITAGTSLVNDLQRIVSRRVDPIDQAVVSVCKFQSGSAFNVIPDKASVAGTVRTFNKETRTQIERDIERIVSGVELTGDVTCSLTYTKGYPTVVNHEKETALVKEVMNNKVGEAAVIERPPMMGAEDFAYYLENVPGTFIHVGAMTDDPDTQYPHHHPRFNFDERALGNIGTLFVSLAESYLK